MDFILNPSGLTGHIKRMDTEVHISKISENLCSQLTMGWDMDG